MPSLQKVRQPQEGEHELSNAEYTKTWLPATQPSRITVLLRFIENKWIYELLFELKSSCPGPRAENRNKNVLFHYTKTNLKKTHRNWMRLTRVRYCIINPGLTKNRLKQNQKGEWWRHDVNLRFKLKKKLCRCVRPGKQLWCHHV